MGTLKLQVKGLSEVTKETVAEHSDYAVATEKLSDADLPQGVLSEDVALQTEYQNVYKFNDGTTKQIISSIPKNYADNNTHRYNKINTVLSKNAEGNLECRKNLFNVNFYAQAEGGKIYSIQKGECGVTLVAYDAKSGNVIFEQLSEEGSNKARLNEIRPGVDIEYEVEPNKIKENIIVKDRRDDYSFRFDINLNNLSVRVAEDFKSLDLVNKTNGEVVFKIPSPVMYDANGECSDAVSYEIEQEEGKLNILVVAEPEYFNAAERAFPVVIDPQVVVKSDEIMSHKVYNLPRGSSGYLYNWTEVPNTFIKVSRNSSYDYKTVLKIDKSKIGLLNSVINNVKLTLKRNSVTQTTGTILVNGSTTYMGTGNLTVDITNKFLSCADTDSFEITVEPYSGYVNGEFYASGSNSPELVIEYIGSNDKPMLKTLSLAEMAEGVLDVCTGETVTQFETVRSDGLDINYGINHLYKQTTDNFGLGRNLRLNLHEKFVKNYSNCDYTDPTGRKIRFEEHYYYLNENNTRVDVSKYNVITDVSGKLTYTTGGKTYDIKIEYRSSTGLQVVTRLDFVKNSELVEQRSDELKQLENQLQSYENALNDFVLVNMNTLEILYDTYISENKYNALKNPSYCCLALSVSEAHQYLNYEDSIAIYNEKIVELNEKLNSLNENDGSYADDSKKLEEEIKESERNIELNATQINLIKRKREYYIKLFNDYYKEYVNLKFKKEYTVKHTPVNYLTDGTLYKGFNEYGDLVTIFDGYGNALNIEYADNNSGTRQINRVYDGENKEISFVFNASGLLISVTDARGRTTAYSYNANNALMQVKYSDGRTLNLTYAYENGKYEVFEVMSSDCLKTVLSYTSGKLTNIKNYSFANAVSDGKITVAAEGKLLSDDTVDYAEDSATIEDKDSNKEKYFFNNQGFIVGKMAEVSGKVVSAEMYDYVPYVKNTIIYAEKETLYKTPFGSFNFVAGDTEITTLNSFNNPVKTILPEKELNLTGTVKQNVTKEYTYNNNQKVIEEKVTVKITDKTDVIQIKKYHYNSRNLVIKTESFVEGEENTAGKVIEETVYDDNGNVVKSFTYNTLDTSSKFYTESEYSENGQVLAEIDETGDNKTKYEYIDGTKIVRTQVLPNGSKFSYGHDVGDNVTAITQSTEDGEENSNQTSYTCGLVTALKSGNNVVKYEYDSKRRKKAVSLNGTDNYVTYNYEEKVNVTIGEEEKTLDKVTVTYEKRSETSSPDVFTTAIDIHGNVLQTRYNGAIQTENAYTKDNKLSKQTDKITNCEILYTYDDLDRVTECLEKNGHPELLREIRTYNDYGNITIRAWMGYLTQTYSYAYNSDAARTLESITVSSIKIKPQTDVLGRNTGKILEYNGNKIAEELISYRKVGDHATNMPSTIRYGNVKNDTYMLMDNLKYSYDKMGNISAIYENGELSVRYTYDALSRLIREDNKSILKTILFTYDNNGNILNKRVLDFTLKDKISLEELDSNFIDYGYEGDRLTTYDGKTFEYDKLGNPTKYKDIVVKWEKGRQLKKYGTTEFVYDGFGRRTKKGNVTYTYDSDGKLLKQEALAETLEFLYDNTGILGIKYVKKSDSSKNKTYIYRKNAQGDVIALLDTAGNVVVKYVYDAWGNNTAVKFNDTNNISELNPFRYRSYYYDTETGLYFLKTRYYDPEIGRFITIDDLSYLDPDTINGLNLYAYCGNNPVMRVDENGTAWWHWVLGVVIVVGLVAATIISAGGFGAGLLAISFAANGLVMTGASITTTIFAFASVGSAVALTASAGVALLYGIDKWARTGDISEGVNVIEDYGSTALSYTLEYSILGFIGGAISYIQQVGNSAQNGFMTPKDRSFQSRKVWREQERQGFTNHKGFEISHIYGTYGTNRNYYIIQTHEEHMAYHHVYGFKTNGGPFIRHNPNIIYWWEYLMRFFG